MAEKLFFDLDYINRLLEKSDDNIRTINNLTDGINSSSEFTKKIDSAQEICTQFATIGSNNTEANTYGWSRIGCLISYVEEIFFEEKNKNPGFKKKTWEMFAEKCFPKIKERRRQQAVRLYEIEKEIPPIVKIYFLGIDRVVPLFSAIVDNNPGNLKELFVKFEIDLSSKEAFQNDTNIRGKIDRLTKFINMGLKDKSLDDYNDLIIRATKVGCDFSKEDMNSLEIKAKEGKAEEYLKRCIANKTTGNKDKDSNKNIESIFCLLAKIQLTCVHYCRNELKIPDCLRIEMINDSIEALEKIKAKIKGE